MALPCVVQSLAGVRHIVSVYLGPAVPQQPCAPTEFVLIDHFVRLTEQCGLKLSALAAAVGRPIWYNYARQTVDVSPAISNGILVSKADRCVVDGHDCVLSHTLSRHVLPEGTSSLWARVDGAGGGGRLWEGLLSESDSEFGGECQLSLYALGGSPGVDVDGTLHMVLPQTEMQGMLALVCAAVAAIYLVGSASFYESGPNVRDVHANGKSTQLFLVDGPLTALVSAVAALMIGDPVQQMPWVIWQRVFLCGGVAVLFAVAVYMIYWCPDARASTLRAVVELPLLVGIYSPLASSASGIVDLAALFLGIGTVFIALRTPPSQIEFDVFDATAKTVAVWVLAPALLAGTITELGHNGVALGIAALGLSLGICAASARVAVSSPMSTAKPFELSTQPG